MNELTSGEEKSDCIIDDADLIQKKKMTKIGSLGGRESWEKMILRLNAQEREDAGGGQDSRSCSLR